MLFRLRKAAGPGFLRLQRSLGPKTSRLLVPLQQVSSSQPPITTRNRPRRGGGHLVFAASPADNFAGHWFLSFFFAPTASFFHLSVRDSFLYLIRRFPTAETHPSCLRGCQTQQQTAIMGDSLCGPSNALQNVQKHASVDRTLQQDRLTSARAGPAQVCSVIVLCAKGLFCFVLFY